ncbi:bacterial transcriptional activator domain-containing protein [Fodinisporobacter ferrooxydans]|uniref:Bacterial transcriptional activator domain-containing protein n=1 Tax=Fodinisporobacter ferrooxydans TaxID=2901836 RepID=A0ABY4CMP6_9BACL|nr:bacterial transcriptional activator domain-containing protein [Alicyclobacillaceae bacterium MYW30-H2]
MHAEDLFGPKGEEWLKAHLGEPWTAEMDEYIRDVWKKQETWLLKCQPEIAFLLLLRQYVWRDMDGLEARVRKLIQEFAVYGEYGRLTGSILLLALVQLEQRGWNSETDALCLQIEQEQLALESYESVLRMFLLAQTAVIRGDETTANLLYKELLDIQYFNDSSIGWLFVRIYEKTFLFLMRYTGHPLWLRWHAVAEHWCQTFSNSPLTERLNPLLALNRDKQMVLSSSKKYEIFEILPVDLLKENCVDNECVVIQFIRKAKLSKSLQDIESARIAAQTYGDPFWIQTACDIARVNSSKHNGFEQEDLNTEIKEPGLFYTFFGIFQGYLKDGNVLFPKSFRRKKVKQFLAYLLLQPDYRVMKEKVNESFFAKDESDHNPNYLHVMLHRLRNIFYTQTGIPDGWVWIHDGMIELNIQRIINVDVQEFLKLASVGHHLWHEDQVEAIRLYRKATGMFRPEVAPEFEYEEWMIASQFNLKNEQQKMLKRLSGYAQKIGSPEQEIYYCEELLKLDPIDFQTLYQLYKGYEYLGEHKKISDLYEYYKQLMSVDNEELPEWMTTVKNALKEHQI